MAQDPIRGVEVRADDDQVVVNREIFRVLDELIARQAADHATIEQTRAEAN